MYIIDLVLLNDDMEDLARIEWYREVEHDNSVTFEIDNVIRDADELAEQDGISGWSAVRLVDNSDDEDLATIYADDEWNNYVFEDREFLISSKHNVIWSDDESTGDWLYR